MHAHAEVGHTFSIPGYGGYTHFKVVSVNETHASFAINMGAPSIQFVGETLIFEIEVLKVYKTSDDVS